MCLPLLFLNFTKKDVNLNFKLISENQLCAILCNNIYKNNEGNSYIYVFYFTYRACLSDSSKILSPQRKKAL